MPHIELEILIQSGKTGVSLAHEIQLRELIRIHLCHGNRASGTFPKKYDTLLNLTFGNVLFGNVW